jgi:hypothetical protein
MREPEVIDAEFEEVTPAPEPQVGAAGGGAVLAAVVVLFAGRLLWRPLSAFIGSLLFPG